MTAFLQILTAPIPLPRAFVWFLTFSSFALWTIIIGSAVIAWLLNCDRKKLGR